MNHSQESIFTLREELVSKDSKWRSIQSEWGPQLEIPVFSECIAKTKASYMDHVMADSLHVPIVRSKCLFNVAVSQMFSDSGIDKLSVPIANQVDAFPGGDKFSVDISAVNSQQALHRNIPEFSKFLLHLAGEHDLADVADPLRDIQKHDMNVLPLQLRHDRII